MANRAKYFLTAFTLLVMALTGCSGAKYAIYRNFEDGSSPIDEYAVVYTSARFHEKLVTKVYKINDNFVHHGYYVLEPGKYTFIIKDTKAGDSHAVVFIPFPNQGTRPISKIQAPMPVLTPNPDRYLGVQNVIAITLKAGYIYDIRFNEDMYELHETQQDLIPEMDRPEFQKAFKFVKDKLPESAYKEGFGPYPIEDGSRP